MNTILTTLARELRGYATSPVSYVIAVLFYLFRGTEVWTLAKNFSIYGADADIFAASYFGLPSTFIMIVLVAPILTMRCFAEEKRTGSFEVLMTAPVRDGEIVLGKWLAALIFYALLWLPTIPLLWILTGESFFAADLAWAPILTGYLGMFLLSALLLAVGVFTSSLTENMLLASLSAMLINFAFVAGIPSLGAALRDVVQENYWVRTVFEKLHVMDHLSAWFSRGLVDTSLIVFYVSGIGFFLFLTTLSSRSRTWR